LAVSWRKANVDYCGVVAIDWIDGDRRPRQNAIVGPDTAERSTAEGRRLDLDDFKADDLRQRVRL
jgi:hypothetical protein